MSRSEIPSPSAPDDAGPAHRSIWFVLPSLDPGGAERVAVNLANGLAASGDRVRILLTGSSGALAADLSDDVPVQAFNEQRVRSTVRALIRAIRHDPPDVLISTHVHVNLLLCAIRPLLPRRLNLVVREPVLIASSTDPGDRRMRRWQPLLYRRADLVLATSEMMRADLIRRVGRRVRLLPNPVDEAHVRAGASAPSALQQATSGRLFIAIGRLVPMKGYRDLLAAFARVSDADDVLTIFGEGPDRPQLEQLVRRLGLEDRTHLRGVDPSLWTHLATSDAMVLASTYEGMPNAVLEALALGVPVIATTDLAVLEELRHSTSDGAITLVPRDALSGALHAVAPREGAARSEIRPSLLPPAHRIDVVIESLRALLDEVIFRRR